MAASVKAVLSEPALARLEGAPRGPVFGVGVLRRDGIVIPFAAYDGKGWDRVWPLPALELTVPISIGGIPRRWWGPTAPLENWELTTSAGTRAARVVQPDWVQAHCVRQIGLKTDYRSGEPSPPRSEQPYPKDGLAVSPPHAVERVEIVPSAALELRGLMPELLKSFNESERTVESRSGHPVARRSREGVEPAIEAAYAYGSDPRVYYVEGTRAYREIGRAARECSAIGFGTGWFVREGAAFRTLTMALDLLNCRRDTASYMLPLGVMRLDNRLYWLAQFSGWDHERYVVLEITSRRVDVQVNVWGGSC
jgi:hypothetical protein